MMRFPFRGHRTMADVVETEELLAWSKVARKLTRGERIRLTILLSLAILNNPPHTEEPGDAA